MRFAFHAMILVVLGVFIFEVFGGGLQAVASEFGAGRDKIEIKPPTRKYFNSPEEEAEQAPEKGSATAPSEDLGEDLFDDRPKAEAAPEQPEDGAQAIERRSKGQMSKAASVYAGKISRACPGQWEKQICLKVMSETYLTAASTYAEALEKAGHKNEQETLKEHCAASTAATKLDDIPAYAMRSAFVECSNEIYAIFERTSVMPDQELSQLMIMGALCLDKDPRCGLMEKGLKATVQ